MNTKIEIYKELANAIVRLQCYITLDAAKLFLSKEDQRVGDIRAHLIRSEGKLEPAVLAEFIEAELKARIERDMLTQNMLPAIIQNIQKKYGITFTAGFMEYITLKGYKILQPL